MELLSSFSIEEDAFKVSAPFSPLSLNMEKLTVEFSLQSIQKTSVVEIHVSVRLQETFSFVNFCCLDVS